MMSSIPQFDVLGAAGPKAYFGSKTRANLGHAYLFTGLPGIGKKTFARRLAQSLLCTVNTVGILGYCNSCSSCRMFLAESATHPDFLEHRGALKIGDSDGSIGFHETEDLTSRDVVRQLMLRSYSGGMRVLLLGDIEFATHHAANALLKFIEEPPAGVLLLLTTPTPGRIIATIRSRVSELRFPQLTSTEVAEILCREGIEPGQAQALAAMANGSLTRARALREGGEEASLRTAVASWFFDVVAGSTPETPWATRETLDEGIELTRALARDWFVRSTQTQTTPMLPDLQDRLSVLAPLTPKAGLVLLASLDQARVIAASNVPPAMVAERIRMALFAATH